MALLCSPSISQPLHPCRIRRKASTHHHHHHHHHHQQQQQQHHHHHQQQQQWSAQRKVILSKPVNFSHIRCGGHLPRPPFLRTFRRLVSSKLSSSISILAVSFSHLASLWHQYRSRESSFRKDSHEFDELCKLGMNGGQVTRRQISTCFSEQRGLAMALLSTKAIAKDQISPAIASLCANPTFMSGLIAWAIAQLLKVFTTFFVEKRWDWKMAVGSGGMPSSHSALCVALTTSVAICHGISDALFPVCLGFSLIVMYDATGVRRHAGMQAEVLNMIVEDLFQGHPLSEKKLKELLGHTPLQVGAGAILGIIVGYLCSQGSTSFPGQV